MMNAHSMKQILDLTVTAVERIHERYVRLRLTHDAPLPTMFPGQFVEVRPDGSATTFLRRPISVNFFDEKKNEMWLLVALVGNGTRAMSRLRPDDKLNCVLPLGNSFTIPASPSERVLLIGGGVGVAPLLFFGHRLKEQGFEPTFLLGARSSGDLLEMDDFKAVGRVFVTTEDGTSGEKGYVTNHTILMQEHFDRIATCGPKPMMAAVAAYAKQIDVECEVSLENKMACGLGACLCCVENTTDGHVCVCTQGPVINSKKLLWHN